MATKLQGSIKRLSAAAGWDDEKSESVLASVAEGMISQAETAARNKIQARAERLAGKHGRSSGGGGRKRKNAAPAAQ